MHYNWHRSYDPTTGRYTQPDPLGFVDGPSVYGYAGGSPVRYADKDGRFIQIIPPVVIALCRTSPAACRTLTTAGALTIYNLFYPPKILYCPTFNNEEKEDSETPRPIDLDDPQTIEGRTKKELKDALDKDPRYEGPMPIRDGNGEKYVKKNTGGSDQVILNDGCPGGHSNRGGDSVHKGPYAKKNV